MIEIIAAVFSMVAIVLMAVSILIDDLKEFIQDRRNTRIAREIRQQSLLEQQQITLRLQRMQHEHERQN